MDSAKDYVITALKLFITISIFMFIIFIIPSILWGVNVNWAIIIGTTIGILIAGPTNYKKIEVEIPIEGADSFRKYAENRLDPSLWRIVDGNSNALKVKPKFDRLYSFIFKESIMIEINENQATLSGSKLYVDRAKDILEGKDLLRNKRIVRYLGNALVIIILLMPTLFHLNIIDGLVIRRHYQDFRVSRIEKIGFEENQVSGNTASNIQNHSMAVESNGQIFYVKDSTSIYKTDKDFSYEEAVISKSQGSGIWHLNIIDDWLFYREGRAFRRMKLDGTKRDTIFTLDYTLGIHILDNWIYFIYPNDNFNVHKMTVNGEQLQRVIEEPALSMGIYDNKIYYSFSSNEGNYFKYLDLRNNETYVIDNIFASNIVIENNSIYYINADDNKLYHYDLLLKEASPLLEDEILSFAKADKDIYYMKRGPDEPPYINQGLYKLDTQTLEFELLSNDYWYRPVNINIVGDWIIYESSTNVRYGPTLKRMSRDGSIVIEIKE